MKKKLLFVLAIVFALTLSLCLTACNFGDSGKENNNGGGTTTLRYGSKDFSNVDLTVLADLTDHSKNATANAVTYDNAVRAEQVKKLQDKQAETKDDLQDDDEDYSTYTKIFKRSDANEIVNRMSVAGLPQDKMVALVGYISRADSVVPAGLTVKEKIEQGKYVFTPGKESLIRDYEDIDELQEYYNDHDDDTDAYDALARKRRKVSQESIQIFKTDADQYARTMLEELLYANKVVDARADLAYGEGGDANDKYINYFREYYFDYETLSFMLAFNETVDLVRDSYTANKRTDFVRLYAYHYQYQKNDTEAFTDAEHLKYLELSHKTTMSDTDAKEYRKLDSQSYQKAYRYSKTFYNNYQTLYFIFQGKQEEYDKQIYVGGTNNQYANGIGAAASNARTTYSSEMGAALQYIESVLKITDTEHQYFLFETNVINMNRANTAWNGLSDSDQGKVANKIYKVNLEVANLKLQDYSLNYKSYLNDNDFIGALKYQIKSYSADYIRTIQSYKKEDVILNEELKRLQAKGADQSEIDAKIEEIGRNTAMYVCLTENYSNANIDGQMDMASNVEWDSIRSEIKEALEKDYATYHKNNQSTRPGAVYVDEYFEDNLVKKKYSCGGTKENCAKGNSHANCTKEYDTDCRISRTINNHENVFRYAYGQVVITYASNADLTAYRIEEVSEVFNPLPGIGNGSGVPSKDATAKPSVGRYSQNNKICMASETIDSDETPTLPSISTSGKWSGNFPHAGNTTLNNATVNENGTVTYVVSDRVNGRDVSYTYYLEFDGWFVDKQLTWRVREDETFSYDVRLYPGYRITKVETKN